MCYMYLSVTLGSVADVRQLSDQVINQHITKGRQHSFSQRANEKNNRISLKAFASVTGRAT